MKNDELGQRMKDYEDITRLYLPKKSYSIIRLDGRSFSNYTKGFKRPFDFSLINAMNSVTKYLCEEIPGVKLAFTQSDEITLVLTDLDNEETQLWFDGNIQKIVSISTSLASVKFNDTIIKKAEYNDVIIRDDEYNYKLATFDARVFTLPHIDEVINCLYWRQKDCTRNAIQMVAQSLYSPKQLHGKKFDDLLKMIADKGIDFDNNYSSHEKRGRVFVKTYEEKTFCHPLTNKYLTFLRSNWTIMEETPRFNQVRESLKNIIRTAVKPPAFRPGI